MTVVADIQRRVDKRLAELEPLIDEYRQLLALKDGMQNPELPDLDGSANAGSRRRKPKSSRARASKSSGAKAVSRSATKTASRSAAKTATAAGKSARRAKPSRRSGGRADQALKMLAKSPGITVKEMAKQMGINDNYLYRLLPNMEKDGKVKRQGSGWAVK